MKRLPNFESPDFSFVLPNPSSGTRSRRADSVRQSHGQEVTLEHNTSNSVIFVKRLSQVSSWQHPRNQKCELVQTSCFNLWFRLCSSCLYNPAVSDLLVSFIGFSLNTSDENRESCLYLLLLLLLLL